MGRGSLAIGPLLALALVGCSDSGGGGAGAGGGSGGAGGGAGGALPNDGAVRLTIEEPEDGALLATRQVRVAGTVTGSPGAVTVAGESVAVDGGAWEHTVTLEPGDHTLVVTAGDARADVSITVDPVPPTLVIEAPERGTWQAEGDLTLRFRAEDTSGLASLTLDGRDIDTGLGPVFELPLTLEPGLHVLRLEATDAAGNLAREHVAALIGPLRAPDEGAPSAFRLHIGPEGFDAIARTARNLIDQEDLTALLPEDGFEFDPFRLSIDRLVYDRPSTVELTAASGRLTFRLRIENVTLDLMLQSGERPPFRIGIGASAIQITGALVPAITPEGGIATAIEDLEVRFEGLAIEVGDAPDLPDDPEQREAFIERLLGEVLELVAERRLPGLLDEYLGRLTEPIDLELLGAALRIVLRPDVLVVSSNGLSARLDARVDLLDPPMAPAPLPGYLGEASDWDGVPNTPQIGLAIHDDVLNLLLFQVWRAGVLFPVIDQERVRESGGQLNLVAGFLGSLVRRAYPDVPRNTPLRLETRLPLPIVAEAAELPDGAGLEVSIGDLAVHIATDDARRRGLIDGSASLVAPASLGAELGGDEGPKLKVTVGEVIGAFDVMTPELRGEIEASLEQPVIELLGTVGGIATALLSDIALPSFDFVTIADLRVALTGASGCGRPGGPPCDFIEVTAVLGD